MPWPLTQPSAVLATDVTAQTTRHAADHNSIAALLVALTPGPWQFVTPAGGVAPTFNAGWSNLGQGWQQARFRREGGDICRMEGLVLSTGAPGGIFTLPLGFRPPQNMRFNQIWDGSGGSGHCRLDVNSAGAVSISAITGSGNVSAVSIACSFAIDPATL